MELVPVVKRKHKICLVWLGSTNKTMNKGKILSPTNVQYIVNSSNLQLCTNLFVITRLKSSTIYLHQYTSFKSSSHIPRKGNINPVFCYHSERKPSTQRKEATGEHKHKLGKASSEMSAKYQLLSLS